MTCNYHRVRSLIREREAGVWGLESSALGEGNRRSHTVFNERNNFERGGFISVFVKPGGEGGGVKINRLSLFLSVLCHGRNDSHLVFFLLFPAGELEKQQGTKAPLLKNNGAQLELHGRQGSPAGVFCGCG